MTDVIHSKLPRIIVSVCVHAGLICGIAQNSLSQIEARDQEEAR